MDNKDIEMPTLKNEEEEVKEEQVVQENNLNKIEIPQEYYDKLEKEKEQRLQDLAKKEEEHKENVQSGGTVILIIFSFIVVFGLLYGMLHFNRLLIIGIPIYIVLGTIISTSSKKENSKFGVSLLVSGMIGALIFFLLAMGNKNTSDKYIYYAYALFVVAFVGYILSLVLVKLLFDKNVKALGKIFYFLIIAAIFGCPYYLYSNYKDLFMKYVFKETEVVGAATEEEYIEKVLANRYDTKFACNGPKKNFIDDITHRRASTITCSSLDGNIELEVMSLYYDEDNKQYIIRDSYIDTTYITPLTKELEESIKGVVSSKSVKISLYPSNKCYFIGDCENDKNYDKEMNLDNLHKYSDELRLKEYIGITGVEFFNKYQFEYNIIIRGNYSEAENFESMISAVVDILEQKGLKNKKGFTITIKDTSVVQDVYKVVGKADNNGSFRNYEVENN